jgi:LacI family transcriptional regulator, repressor for deo operon, udp, cdd, tsx, nupC, and nupG
MAVTMRDVARYAGVSPRTVSNVVNNFELVSDSTRERVQRAIDTLGYRPNLMARSLRHGRSGLIVLAVPELNIPYFSELAGEIIEEAAKYAYTVVIEQTDGRLESERRLLDQSDRTLLADGLIFSPLALGDPELRQRASHTPVLLLGEHVTDGQYDHVGIDNVAAARAAVEHLLQIGRQRIAAIGHQFQLSGETAQYRTQGYRTTLEAAGCHFDPALLASTPSFHRDSGALAMGELLDLPDPPDAVFCYNDLLAIGAMRMLSQRGLRVPDDVAVVGFDDIEEGRYATTTLTTISPNKRQIAAEAVGQLYRRIEGDHEPAVSMRAEFHLSARESTLGRSASRNPSSP